jgi:hypothetical protein
MRRGGTSRWLVTTAATADDQQHAEKDCEQSSAVVVNRSGRHDVKA